MIHTGDWYENPAKTGIVPEGYMTSQDFMAESRKDLDEICLKHGLYIESPALSGIVPEGYVTGNEFERQVIERINSYCKENGFK